MNTGTYIYIQSYNEIFMSTRLIVVNGQIKFKHMYSSIDINNRLPFANIKGLNFSIKVIIVIKQNNS